MYKLLGTPDQFSLGYLACKSCSHISPTQMNGFHNAEICVPTSWPTSPIYTDSALSPEAGCGIHKTQVLVPPESHVSLDTRQRGVDCDAPRREKDTE